MAQVTKCVASALPGRFIAPAPPPAPLPPYTNQSLAADIHVGMPWRGLMPVPDADIDIGDLAQAATYARIGVLVPPGPYLDSALAAYVHIGLPWRGLLPVPDADIDAEDLAQLATFARLVPVFGGGGIRRRAVMARFIQPIRQYGHTGGSVV